MKFTFFGIFLINLGIFTAIFMSNLSKIISVHTDPLPELKQDRTTSSFSNLIISNTSDHLIWFLQISDLHISLFHDRTRVEDFKHFCDHTIKAIQPFLVLATGDLTDAKESDNVGSRQFIEEWRLYNDILSRCTPLKKVKWLDIRGNHDNFDVPGVRSNRNLFMNYSMLKEPSSYSVTEVAPGGSSYTFIALDACPDQGLKRPFNFVGIIRQTQVAYLRKIISLHKNSSYFIWFGHYPTSCILSEADGVRKIIGEDRRSLVYLCGHLHTLGGLVPSMYTLQKHGFLELELADWKDSRMYRLLAIDHGLLSFVDLQHGDWPLILVTNPKKFITASDREPLSNIKLSTHIRILVFSIGLLKKVEVKINNGNWTRCVHIKGPLYVLPWDPANFIGETSHLQVLAADYLGNEKIITHEFSLNGKQYKYNFWARVCLMTNISSVFQLLFGLSIVSCVVPLCLLRYLNRQVQGEKKILSDLKSKFLRRCIRKIWLVSNIDRFFYPLIIYPLYLTVGPWTIGELIEGHVGVVFSWGVIINGHFLPGGFTYTHGFFQLLLFQWPFILCLSHLLEKRLMQNTEAYERRLLSRVYDCVPHVIMTVLLLTQLYMAYYFWLAYGTMSVLLGPFRLWPVLTIIWSWKESSAISTYKLRNAAFVWLGER